MKKKSEKKSCVGEMTLGDRLKVLREAEGVSVQLAANAIGTTRVHLWQLEEGRSSNPTLNLLMRLADYYETSIAYLVGEESHVARAKNG